MTATSATPPRWDVIIIGGGPAGSTAATTLAKAGRKVLLLEKERFPRFHVGESLLPYNQRIFDQLGVSEKLSQAGFMVKRGAQFIMGNDSHGVRLDFSKGSFTECPTSFQVERSKFDDLLLQHSRECGAAVQEGCLVLESRVEPGQVTVRYRSEDGSEAEATARFMMDASGLSNFTGTREGLREYYPGHKKIAIFGHHENLDMPQGEEKGDILIIRRENSWFWMIPLEDKKTSVGLVLDQADFKAMGKTKDEVYAEAVAGTPAVNKRFVNSTQTTPLHVVTDFSYRNGRLVSPRQVRIGDASGFIDPIFSSGVLLAMTSGIQGAEAVHCTLDSGDSTSRALEIYEKENRARIAQYWEFIENFYRLHFAQIFFQPHPRLRMTCSINCVLAGRTRLSFAAWWRLRLFFLLVRINKYFPVTPRIRVN